MFINYNSLSANHFIWDNYVSLLTFAYVITKQRFLVNLVDWMRDCYLACSMGWMRDCYLDCSKDLSSDCSMG